MGTIINIVFNSAKNIFFQPLLLFTLTGLFVHKTLEWIISIFLSIIIQFLVNENCRLYLSKSRAKDSISWFIKKKNTFLFKEYQFSQIVERFKFHKLIVLDITFFRRAFSYSPKWREFRKSNGLPTKEQDFFQLFQVIPIKGLITSSLRTYSSYVAQSVIFTPVSPDTMSSLQKFLFLHELGHLTFLNIQMQLRKYSMIVYFIIVFLIILISQPLNWLLIPLIIIFLFNSIYYYDGSYVNVEIQADTWALSRLDNVNEVQEVVNKLRFIWKRYDKKNTFFKGWDDVHTEEEAEEKRIRDTKNYEFNMRLNAIESYLKDVKNKKGYFEEKQIITYNSYNLATIPNIIILIVCGFRYSSINNWNLFIIALISLYVLYRKKGYRESFLLNKMLTEIINRNQI